MRALPREYRVVSVGCGHVVVGPTGAFALVWPQDDVAEAAAHVARLAADLRQQLAQRFSWAPFVDAFVVTDDDVRSDRAAVVPPRHLGAVLTRGRRLLGRDDVDRIVAALRATPALA